MNFRDYLTVATRLMAGATEADWRSAISRAYYAAFHVGCDLLRTLGFRVPRADRAHAFVWLRLSNSGHPDVNQAGSDLNQFRGERNRADYDARSTFRQATAFGLVGFVIWLANAPPHFHAIVVRMQDDSTIRPTPDRHP